MICGSNYITQLQNIFKGGPLLVDTSLVSIVEANKELIEVARRSESSVLRNRTFDGLANENWMAEVLAELETRCPIVNNILCALLERTVHLDKKTPAISLIYGIILFMRCHELSRIQRVNSVLLLQGHASVNVSDYSLIYCVCTGTNFKVDVISQSFLIFMAKLISLKYENDPFSVNQTVPDC